MKAIQYARENGVAAWESVWVCSWLLLNMLAILQVCQNCFCRFNRSTKYPLIGLITEWLDERGELQQRSLESDLGGQCVSVHEIQNWLKAQKLVKSTEN